MKDWYPFKQGDCRTCGVDIRDESDAHVTNKSIVLHMYASCVLLFCNRTVIFNIVGKLKAGLMCSVAVSEKWGFMGIRYSGTGILFVQGQASSNQDTICEFVHFNFYESHLLAQSYLQSANCALRAGVWFGPPIVYWLRTN